MASEKEFADFLQEVEKRAFKKAFFHVKDEDAALDIVQDSMMRLAENYADKPIEEVRMLFNRILTNSTLDWFRRQKTRNAVFSNFSDFERHTDEDDTFSLLENYAGPDGSELVESAETTTERKQVFQQIEEALKKLPARQREAFIMRYWEDMDVAETAAAMGCSEGSVKTHCFRAVQALSSTLSALGVKL
ncbi:RNA polymerase sigma factor [Lampropedia puyangensis]|uniref:RNA polymerase sigma factor n=1 Tax=Lampropedia puyangensis TaxID=1330072 RepID=A0A4S8F7Z7_9BURK|nr:RNA polymerase sigma factor [Lampropedia puyangensis]THU02785.1 RNA polymerase sigma factor [Lampropedia puyangensis]